MKTTLVQDKDVVRQWHLIDAAGLPAGRLATQIAFLLRGKNKITFAPHIDGGDFVVVINAAKVKLTGNKEEQKLYKHFTGYPDGLKTFTAAEVRKKNPTRIVEQAVKGMLPKNHLSRTQIKRLKVYAGEEHPHIAQQPQALAVA
ncbi:MAG: 50S ribosomal protein L13 [Kiritimatiellia bacterium]|jgi:large subunit ribosomal protein L13